jgi:hypothetical protein
MKYRVLMVGDDPDLLALRVAMASPSWLAAGSSTGGAMYVLEKAKFDLVVFCAACQV